MRDAARVLGATKSIEGTINYLRSLSDPDEVKGMARFGINPRNTFGISVPTLRRIAKQIGRNHSLARELWKSGVHEDPRIDD
jgi:3-methyladenine DNA glycosylase AlkD